MKKYIFIIIAISALFSCSSPKDPFGDRGDLGKINPREMTIKLTTNNNTRVIGSKMENSRGIKFTWSPTDKVYTVYSQDGKCYKTPPLNVLEIDNNYATVKPIIPTEIDRSRPFDIYGYVGNMASWVEPFSGGVPSLSIQKTTQAFTSVEEATKDIPLYFVINNANSDILNVVNMHHLGMMVAVSIVNNTNHTNPINLNINKLSLFITDENNEPTLPKAQSGTFVYSLDGSTTTTDKNFSLDLNCTGSITRGNEISFYSWVYYPEDCNVDNVNIGFDIYANGKKYPLQKSHEIRRQATGFSYNYCASYYEDKMENIKAVPSEIKGNNWMKYIDDNRPFLSLLLVGTHDAATYGNSGIAQCQGVDIKSQLNSGVRSLDLRPKKNKDNNDIYIYHGIASTGVLMSQVFDNTIEFLKENPQETVLFLIKDENSKGGKDINLPMLALVTKYERYIYRTDVTTNTKLSDVRGKIILLFRDELIANTNNLMYVGGWPDNTSYAVKGVYKIPGGSNDNWSYKNLFITILEDNYSRPDKDNKIKLYKNAIDESFKQKIWNISYLSANGGLFGWTPWNYAYYINPRITSFYRDEVDVNYNGVTFVDYAGYEYGSNYKGTELVRQLYLNNFKKLRNM